MDKHNAMNNAHALDIFLIISFTGRPRKTGVCYTAGCAMVSLECFDPLIDCFHHGILCVLSVIAPCITLTPASLQSCVSAMKTMFMA
jgi:hypothetical protein